MISQAIATARSLHVHGPWSVCGLLALLVVWGDLQGCAPRPRDIPEPDDALPAFAATVDGTVVGPEGGGVEGSVVALVPASDLYAETVSTLTRQGGRFRFGRILPGNYAITATAPGLTAGYLAPVHLNDRGVLVHVTVHLGGEGVVIKGRVFDAASKPLYDHPVRLARKGDQHGDLFLVFTNSQGWFEAKVPTARYQIRIQDSDAEPYVFDTVGGDTTVTVVLRRSVTLDGP